MTVFSLSIRPLYKKSSTSISSDQFWLKQLVRVCWIVLILFSALNQSKSQCNTTLDNGGRTFGNGIKDAGQSFEVSCSGTLNTISVIGAASGSGYTVTVYDGAGTAGTNLGSITGQSIIQETVSLTNFATVFDFSSLAISLTADTPYTFVITGTSDIKLFHYGQNSSNPSTAYADGQVYASGSAVSFLDINFSVDVVAGSSNTAPGISGTVASQAVNDNATVSLFSGVSITDSDGDNVTATITLDNNAKGVITGADAGSGPYTMSSRTAAAMTTAIQALTFNPTDNRTSTSETTTFTLTINDGTVDTDDNSTTVVSSAVAPTLSSSSPTNGATGVSASGNLTLTFGEDINFGSGNIQIIDTDDNSNSFTIDVNSNAGQLSITDNVLTVDLSTDLAKARIMRYR